MRTTLSVFLLVFSMAFIAQNSFAQKYLKKNEQTVFSFKTKDSTKIIVAVDTNEKYIVCRLGDYLQSKMEFPTKDTSSWRKIGFYSYLRPHDGKGNGLDLNNITFVVKDTRYVIYENYVEGEKDDIGISLYNLSGQQINDRKYIKKSNKGSLINLRSYRDKMGIGSESYENHN